MSEKNNNPGQIDIELSEEIADGVYSNLAIITHSSSEFILDYVRILPGIPKGKVKSRVLMSPEHAKRLMLALQDNIEKYEAQFGEINVSNNQPTGIPMNYGGQTGQA